ncbi:hypothetical protein [Aquiflexum sp.]|uniref:hypothetical protein n=1 Tax=Aquiflexum sp. TaxID=1872584 RepID=UPI003593FAE3
MSELISHAAFFNDVAKMVPIRKNFHAYITNAIRKYPDHAFYASASRGNHLYAVPLLEKAKTQEKDKSKEQENLKMVSAALGWNIHRAIDLVTKPHSIKRTGTIPPGPSFSADEGEIYQDAITYNHVLENGKLETIFKTIDFNEYILSDRFNDHPTGKYFRIEDLELLISGTVTSEMYGIQHSNKKVKNAEEAEKTFHSGFQKYSEQFKTYVNAYHFPDPEKIDFYIRRINFFNTDDHLIRLAKKSQKEEVQEAELDKALIEAQDQSIYAQGIAKALYFIQSSDRFLKNEISKDEIYDALENFHPPFRI